MDKLFLVEKGTIVVVRDGIKEVFFPSFENFNLYYPSLTLTGKWFIDYEPERSLYVDSTLNIEEFQTVPEYDAVIADIDNLIAKKNDVYFNKTVDEVRAIRGFFIKNQFNEKINEGCLTSLGFRFDCDDSARSNTMAAVMLLQLSGGTEIDFIDYDNIKRTLSTSQMIQVGLEIGAYFQATLYKKNALYTLIKEIPESETAIEEIKAINWNSLP